MTEICYDRWPEHGLGRSSVRQVDALVAVRKPRHGADLYSHCGFFADFGGIESIVFNDLPQRVCFNPEGIVLFSPRLARLGMACLGCRPERRAPPRPAAKISQSEPSRCSALQFCRGLCWNWEPESPEPKTHPAIPPKRAKNPLNNSKQQFTTLFTTDLQRIANDLQHYTTFYM